MRSLSVLFVAVMFVQACVASTVGEAGNLKFSYFTDDVVLHFSAPIAVGARLTLTVAEAGNGQAVSVTDVVSSDEAVLKVVGKLGDKIEVEGVASGSAKIDVTAKRKFGGSTSDSLTLTVNAPQKHTMFHWCNKNAPVAAYQTNSKILVGYEMTRTGGQAVVGYGLHPIDMAPEGVLTVDATSKDQLNYHYSTGAEPGDVTLTSQIDGSTLTVRLINEAQVDGGYLEGGDFSKNAFIGQSHWVLIRPTVGDLPVCQPTMGYTATSKTPAICSVKESTTTSAEKGSAETYSWVQIDGKEVGVCEFDVTWAKGNGGKGTTATIQVNINKVVTP